PPSGQAATRHLGAEEAIATRARLDYQLRAVSLARRTTAKPPSFGWESHGRQAERSKRRLPTCAKLFRSPRPDRVEAAAQHLYVRKVVRMGRDQAPTGCVLRETWAASEVRGGLPTEALEPHPEHTAPAPSAADARGHGLTS